MRGFVGRPPWAAAGQEAGWGPVGPPYRAVVWIELHVSSLQSVAGARLAGATSLLSAAGSAPGKVSPRLARAIGAPAIPSTTDPQLRYMVTCCFGGRGSILPG